jgi:hypothetical protein
MKIASIGDLGRGCATFSTEKIHVILCVRVHQVCEVTCPMQSTFQVLLRKVWLIFINQFLNLLGEISELRADLNSLSETTKKDAVKKVIALMTVGKDVSKLFADVLKCITTSNLELKKLVYLYVMNYAKSNEEMAILVVNTLQQVRAVMR